MANPLAKELDKSLIMLYYLAHGIDDPAAAPGIGDAKENDMAGKFGVNGNYHSVGVDYFSEIEGLSYNGDGHWTLPAGYSVRHVGEGNWLLTDDDGNDYRVWTEE